MARVGIFSDSHMQHDVTAPRFEDSRHTLGRIVRGMIEAKVELALFGGDAFQNHHPPQAVVHIFGEELRPLLDRGINVVAVVGNHDLAKSDDGRNALSCLHWKHGFYLASKPHVVGFSGLQLVLLPYPNRNILMTRSEYANLTASELNEQAGRIVADILRELAEEIDPKTPSILLAHVSPAQASAGSENTYMFGRDICLSVADIPENINYAFFGHIHKPQMIDRLPGDAFTGQYAYVIGSTDQCNFGEEGEDKRWLLLDTDEGTVTSMSTGCKRHRTLHFDITETGHITTFAGLPVEPFVRAKVKLNRGQVVPADLKEKLLKWGAEEVQIDCEYTDESRLTSGGSGAVGESNEDVLRAYCEQRNIAESRREPLVKAGLDELRRIGE
jgi:DNA repair exonuclease SbcCD nuclease subunit